MSEPVYAIADVHGQRRLLADALARVRADYGGDGAKVVVLGDLVDRGPDSRGVVEDLMAGQAEGRRWVVLKGNHDRFLPRLLDDPDWIDPGVSSGQHWLDHPGLGAAATLASWGVDAAAPRAEVVEAVRAAVPPAQVAWLAGLPAWHLTPQALFVHAGLRPGVDLQAQAEQDLLWIRKGWLDDPRSHGALVVHGHTAQARATHHGNRVNIDSGAGHGGPLTTVVLDAGGVAVLDGRGRVPLEP